MSAADERAKVSKAVRVDFDKALILAENVLTLNIVVNHLHGRSFAPEGKVIPVANKALKAASLGADAYKRVAGRCDENIGSTTESLAQTVLRRS